jgi:hypothetical protein
MALGGHSLRDE